MPRGRRPNPGSAEQKAALRREKVRLNVRAYRERKKAGVRVDDEKLRWVTTTPWQEQYDHLHQRRANQLVSKTDDNSPTRTLLILPLRAHSGSDSTGDLLYYHATPKLLMDPKPDKGYSLGLLELFPQRFLPAKFSLPDTDDIGALRTPCALWVTTAVCRARANDAGPLNDILHAVALAMIGASDRNNGLAMSAQRLYLRGLSKTRREIESIGDSGKVANENRELDLFLSCHAATVYELLVNGSMPDMLRHVLGIGQLIEHQRCLPNFPRILCETLLEEYRTLEIQFCLLERRLSTTNRLKRIGASPNPNARRPSAINSDCGIVTALLDLADQILPLMVEFDHIKDRASFRDARLTSILDKAANLHHQLDMWSEYLRSRLTTDRSCSNASSLEDKHFDIALIRSYDFAFCYLFSLSFDLHAIETWLDVATVLHCQRDSDHIEDPTQSAQALSWRTQLFLVASRLLELLPYFLQDDKGIVGCSMPIWPLEVVWSMLERESERSARNEATADEKISSPQMLHKVATNKQTVAKCLKMCQEIARKLLGYGLSLAVERPVVENCDADRTKF